MILPGLSFREPMLSDADAVRFCTRRVLQSDLSFANIYLLKKKYGTEIVFHMEHLIRHFSGDGRLRGYTFPISGAAIEDALPCLRAIENDAKARGEALRFCLLTEEQVDYMRSIYGDKMVVNQDDGDADYLYKRESLASLPGPRFHKKRTHINAFLKKNSHTVFRELSTANREDALHIASAWLRAQDESPALHHEYRAIENALQHMEQLQMGGGIVYVQGTPIAMALYSQINEHVTDIHYEKCVPEFRDAYAFINREIAASVNTEWLNREEDLNIPGLRKAKLSYYPSLILKKYTATIYAD